MKTARTKLVLMLVNLIFASSVFCQCLESIPQSVVRFEKPNSPSNGLVLLVHGLNLKPEKMNELADWFLLQNYSIANIALAGHEVNSLDLWSNLSLDQWKKQMEELANWLKHCEKRWIGVGQSTGAVMLYWMAQQELAPPPLQFYFFAPAFFPRYPLSILSWFADWFPTLTIPSANLEEYRVHNGTTLSAYQTLYQASLIVKKSQRLFERMILIQSKDDELVDEDETQKWLQLPNERWWYYRAEALNQKTIQHLMIDHHTIGQKNWDSLLDRLSQNLKNLPL